jgi:hypothetical protein
MPEEEGGYRNGMSLARWQGGVDASITGHDRRISANEQNLTNIGSAIVQIRQDIRDQTNTIREIKEQGVRLAAGEAERLKIVQSRSQFRWTKATVFIAAAAVLATVVLNLYFASGQHG